ncbi:MAG: UDP-2,3-diacylglucosamine diphosphatase [Planctomycetota bacterium]
MSRVRFVSDVHLSQEDPDRADRFARFLGEAPSDLARLLVLGDLFDYWVGPSQAAAAEYAGVLDALAALTRRGVAIDFVPGNRDFLAGADLAARTGMRLLGDEALVDQGGVRVLATHGDLLCTRDTHYQAYRRFARSPLVRWAFGRLPESVRSRVARGWERKSASIVAAKPESTTRIPDEAVERALARGFDAVVCGHAHRLERRELPGGVLYVLGSWESGGSWLDLADGRLRFGSVEGPGGV